MKKIIPGVSLLFAALLICLFITSCKTNYKPVLSSQQGINFTVTSVAEAKQMAKAQHKPLFVFAHASWCPTCKKMEHEVLIRKELGTAFNQNFVNVAIDVDSPEGKKLNELYPIRATPTLFFFNADGSLAKKTEGFADTEELQAVAQEITSH